MVAEVKGGGWGIGAFSPDKATACVANYQSVQKTSISIASISPSASMTPIGDHKADVAYGGSQFAPDGTVWVTSDEGSDFQRLGTLDPATGKFTPTSAEKWDVDGFDLSDDGKTHRLCGQRGGIEPAEDHGYRQRRGADGRRPARRDDRRAADRAVGRDRPVAELGAQRRATSGRSIRPASR